MHRILLNFKLPYFLKAVFGVFPLGLGIIFGIVGLAFLFFGPKWIMKEDEQAAMKKTADKKEEYTSKQKMWLRFTFWVGIVFIVIGIGSVGVTLLDNSELEKAANEKHAMAIGSIDESITDPSVQQAYDLLVNQETYEWLKDAPSFTGFRNALSASTVLPDWASRDKDNSYKNTYSVRKCRDFMQYMKTSEKVDYDEFKNKFEDFKTIPKHLPLKTIEVPSYGVMVMLGFLAAILIGYARAKQYGIDPNIIIDLGIVVMIAAIVGARLWHVIEFWSDQIHTVGKTLWQAMGKAVMIQQGGLVFYGGMILALLSAAVYLRVKKQSIFLYFDFLAIIVPLGHAFGRTGCFLNGCCFGKTCDVHHFLAVAFPDGSPATAMVQPVYATQALAVVTNIIIFILLTIYYETLAKKRGETFFMYFLLYGISRFISHLLRGDVPQYDWFFGLSSSQFLSVIFFVIGLAGVIFFRFFREKDKAPHLAGIGNVSPFRKVKLSELSK